MDLFAYAYILYAISSLFVVLTLRSYFDWTWTDSTLIEMMNKDLGIKRRQSTVEQWYSLAQ